MLQHVRLLKRIILSISALTIVAWGIGPFNPFNPIGDSAHASLNGRIGFSGNPATNGGQSCTTCHLADPNAPVNTQPTITLSGPDAVAAGSTHLYTLLIEGGPAAVAGVNVAASLGGDLLAPVETDLQKILNELTHSAPKSFTNGEASFTFAWTAPDYSETITLYAAGNSANGDQDLSGDEIATTQFVVNVTGGGSPPAATSTPAPPAVTLEEVASGLNQPTDIQSAGDQRLFVTEKSGLIRIIDGTLLDEPFLDITDRISTGSGNEERGLLGLAFHPNYAANGYFYLNYTVASPLRSRISRFTTSTQSPPADGLPTGPDFADPGSELILMEFAQPDSNHNGGQLQFGPDGYLYISSGDGGSQGDPSDLGQNNGTLLGKILRIDVDNSNNLSTASGLGDPPDCNQLAAAGPEEFNYSVPTDNPFADGPGGNCDEIWATGLRNPWRFSFDRLTGEQWITDVGQNRYEEINFAATGQGGDNYGWRCYEATTPYETAGCSSADAYDMPLYWYDRSSGDCSITGGYVYRGAAYPSLNGHYFFSDFCNSTLRSISGAPDTTLFSSWTPTGNGSNIATFGEDMDGELYVGFFSGHIARLVGPAAPTLPTATLIPETPIPGTPTVLPTEPAATVVPTIQTATATATAQPSPTDSLPEIPQPTAIPISPTATVTPTTTDGETTTLPPTATVTPSLPSIHLGNPIFDADAQSISLPIELWNIPSSSPLSAVSLGLAFDGNQLAVISCQADPSEQYDAALCNAQSQDGTIRVSALSGAGIASNHALAELTFRSKGLDRPAVAVEIVNLELADMNGNNIEMERRGANLFLACLFGDVDCSGTVDQEDSIAVAQYAVGKLSGDQVQPLRPQTIYLPGCDANQDGKCSTYDGFLILQCVLKQQGDAESTERPAAQWCSE